MSARRPLPRDFENLAFEAIEEHWNEYELSNQIKIRGRVIVTRFAKNPNDPNPNAMSLSSQNIFVVDAPVEQRGDPSGNLTPEEIRNPQGGVPVNILTSDEQWNKYRILSTGVVLKVKLVVDDAVRMENRYDNDGMPQFIFHSAPIVIPDRHANTNVRT